MVKRAYKTFTSMDDVEEVISSSDRGGINEFGYRAMTPEQAIKVANDKVKAMGIETVVDYEYDDFEEGEYDDQGEITETLQEVFAEENEVVKDLMEVEEEKREQRRQLIRSEGFKCGLKCGKR